MQTAGAMSKVKALFPDADDMWADSDHKDFLTMNLDTKSSLGPTEKVTRCKRQ